MDLATIQKRIEMMEKYEAEIRNAREMLQGELENSPEYLQAEEAAKEAINNKKKIKEEIIALGPNQKLVGDIKANTEEISVLKEILSAELIQVYQENKSDEITDADGEPRKFKLSVKLLPKKGKFKDRNSIGQFINDK